MQVSLITRINVVLGVLAFSLLPLAAEGYRIRAREMDATQWIVVSLAIIILQALLLLAQRRCSSKAMPFWRGIMIVGVSMRTQWIYLDMLLALIAIPLALVASIGLLLGRAPAARFHRLVYTFYQHRMEQ